MTILTTLHQDHINMSKLLTVLEHNLAQIRQGMTPDLKLMAEAIEYLGHYADLYHHPLEDILYSYFINKDDKLTSLINQCEREHRILKQKTEQILNPISVTLLDDMLPLEQILTAFEDFLIVEKQHINFEEGQLFPLIKQMATADDWQKIAKKTWLKTDAMFHEFDSQQYSGIYQELSEALKQ
ncbi:MAG: hemerythrin domain-containing protein [Oceanospirillaceae bacterium]